METELKISNYRLFTDLTIQPLGRVNLFAGKNNTGKTALLEAIRILAAEGDSTVLNHILKSRGQFNPGWAESYDSFFNRALLAKNQNGQDHSFQVSSPNTQLKFSRFHSHGGEVDYRTAIPKAPYAIPLESTVNISTTPDNPKDQAIFLPFTFQQFPQKDLWDKISLTPAEDEVIEILKVIEPKLVRIEVGYENSKVRLAGEENPIPLKNLGDGVSRFLTIALALVNAKGKLLLIDEFESGLHHSVQEKLWDIIFDYARKWDIQVFATTHSLDAVRTFFYSMAKPEHHGLGQFFRLQKSRAGAIEAVTYSEEELELVLLANTEPR